MAKAKQVTETAAAEAALVAVEEVKAPAERADEEQIFKRCGCGCDRIIGKASKYATGHDQVHKGALLRTFDAGDMAAGELLVEKGWRTPEELQARKAKAEAKAEARVQSEQARQKRAQARAEAKAAKAAKPAVEEEVG